ncbi:hypothetical protein [Pengzhenrongella sicca]|uniref:Uncharacterized protein n=1 Tax=Pengzhenrongella sicca TaxID=2819238 RepID=A0A8A4ZEM5_9MICO|nr:hypothetical protein [Pengzhenrongella sicca]QTE29363.1 hypothetical protein J4E96_19175 [Pengzhenrongella sicca]
MAKQRAIPNVWAGILRFISGSATAMAQLLGIVAEDTVILAASAFVGVSGLVLISLALRAGRRAQ